VTIEKAAAKRPLRRVRGGLALAVLAALLGIGSADGWRIHPAVLGTLASLQAVWALGAFVSGRYLAHGRTAAGFAAGSAFGLAAIASYYLYEWLAYTALAATSQLTSSGGAFWGLAAVLGGGLMGIAGVMSGGRRHGRRLEPAAIAWTFTIAVVVSEIVFVVVRRGWFPADEPVRTAAVILAAVTVGLLVLAVRDCGVRAVAYAGVGMAFVTPFAATAFFALEHHVGYVTL
jgi:hypothetical protein